MLRSMLNRFMAGGTRSTGRRRSTAGRRGRYGAGTRGRSSGGTGAQIGAMVERFVRGRRRY
jgi:hypothetical protein